MMMTDMLSIQKVLQTNSCSQIGWNELRIKCGGLTTAFFIDSSVAAMLQMFVWGCEKKM